METSVMFDTLAFAKKLKASGVPEAQAEVHAEALRDILEEKIATKADLKQLESHLTIRMGLMLAAAVGILASMKFFG